MASVVLEFLSLHTVAPESPTLSMQYLNTDDTF